MSAIKEAVMKKTLVIVCAQAFIIICLIGLSSASFTIPYNVYRINTLAEAAEKARSGNMPVAFVYSDANTTCRLATAASEDAMEILKEKIIVVYVSKEDWKQIPEIVRKAIKSSAAGNYIPKTIVVSPDMRTVVSTIPYIRDREQRREQLKKVRNEITR